MPRRANDKRLQKAWSLILRSPGQRASFYASQLRIHCYDFNTLLAMLNERGFLLTEDDDGCLWVFEPEKT